MARTKLVSRNSNNRSRAQFCAAQAASKPVVAAAQVWSGKKKILNRRIREKTFKMKKNYCSPKMSRLTMRQSCQGNGYQT